MDPAEAITVTKFGLNWQQRQVVLMTQRACSEKMKANDMGFGFFPAGWASTHSNLPAGHQEAFVAVVAGMDLGDMATANVGVTKIDSRPQQLGGTTFVCLSTPKTNGMPFL